MSARGRLRGRPSRASSVAADSAREAVLREVLGQDLVDGIRLGRRAGLIGGTPCEGEGRGQGQQVVAIPQQETQSQAHFSAHL